MNKLPICEQVRVISALVEGNSIRATCRMTGVAKGTVIRLLERVGYACAVHHSTAVRNVRFRRVQADEIWTYCYAKERNLPAKFKDSPGYGDAWTWVAIDRDTKLAISWLLGERNPQCARLFMRDLRDRVVGRIQLSTDGLPFYQEAVELTFAGDVDFGQLIKVYESDREGEVRYSPSKFVGATRKRINGTPVMSDISTSHVERQNLTMRMKMRRFTRLTNAFSKKIENLDLALALHFVHYNFCRIHQTLKTTPAIAAGIASHVWSIYDVVAMMETIEAEAA
jgi:IS1 family transposase